MLNEAGECDPEEERNNIREMIKIEKIIMEGNLNSDYELLDDFDDSDTDMDIFLSGTYGVYFDSPPQDDRPSYHN